MRILVCDDHVVVRAGCSPCSTAPPASRWPVRREPARRRSRSPRLAPDVVLMDLQLGEGIDGVETTRRLTQAGGTAPHVLVLTTYDTDADITRAIEAGATGCLLKAERPEELFAAIHAAAEGRTALSGPVASRVMANMRSPRPLPHRPRTRHPGPARHRTRQPGDRPRPVHQRGHGEDHLRRIYDKLGVDTARGRGRGGRGRRLLPVTPSSRYAEGPGARPGGLRTGN